MGGACEYGKADNARLQHSAFAVADGALKWDRECLVWPGVSVHVRDVFRWSAPGLVAWQRSWWHEHSDTLRQLELSAAIEIAGRLHSHLLPGILYDGNAGAIPSRLVPRLSPDGENLFEEHKFPTPFVHAESAIDLNLAAVTLEAVPAAVVDGNLPDQWWSLGIDAPKGRRARLLSVSGRVALNGRDQTIYDAQNHASEYRDAWVNARPKQVYEKHYRIHLSLDGGDAAFKTWRAPLLRCLAEQPPLTAEERAWTAPAALEDAVQLKTKYALNRWFENEQACGMLWHPKRPDYAGAEQSVEYGWVGQNMRLGLSLWRWGRRKGDADLMGRGTRIADRWLAAASEFTRQGKPAPTRYVIKRKSWGDVMGSGEGYSRATFETLYELALFCRRLRDAGAAQESREAQLFALLDWYLEPQRLSDGLYPLVWSPEGAVVDGPAVTAGALSVAALAEASALPGGARFLETAKNLMRAYAAGFLEKGGVHPCGSALDSGCEDMESGMFLLIAARSLYAVLRAQQADDIFSARVLEWANHAADWVLTWAYTWNVPLLPGTLLGDAGLKTRGMSDVSVQNRHLHVFSPAAEIAHFAALLDGDPGASAGLYREQAQRMLVPVLQTIARPGQRWGMDEDGEQTEQYNQTNYIQHPNDPVCKPRGGIARWFVPWMTTWVMSMCLDFLELPATSKAAPDGVR